MEWVKERLLNSSKCPLFLCLNGGGKVVFHRYMYIIMIDYLIVVEAGDNILPILPARLMMNRKDILIAWEPSCMHSSMHMMMMMVCVCFKTASNMIIRITGY